MRKERKGEGVANEKDAVRVNKYSVHHISNGKRYSRYSPFRHIHRLKKKKKEERGMCLYKRNSVALVFDFVFRPSVRINCCTYCTWT